MRGTKPFLCTLLQQLKILNDNLKGWSNINSAIQVDSSQPEKWNLSSKSFDMITCFNIAAKISKSNTSNFGNEEEEEKGECLAGAKAIARCARRCQNRRQPHLHGSHRSRHQQGRVRQPGYLDPASGFLAGRAGYCRTRCHSVVWGSRSRYCVYVSHWVWDWCCCGTNRPLTGYWCEQVQRAVKVIQ